MQQELGLLRLGGVLESVLHVARGVVEVALRLVHLAFGLKLLVARELAGGVLDGSLRLVGGALHVFLVHSFSPFVAVASTRAGAKSSLFSGWRFLLLNTFPA